MTGQSSVALVKPFALPERYRLERGIAAGGMAAVYAAHDTVLDRPVAVKVLADHLNDDVVARARFEREARAAAAVSSHPGVVTIFDVGEHDGRAFIVMERREGGTLADLGRVPAERALGWLRTVADALDAAHAQGVVHRDIKPANLLLDERDAVAVADFGIASLADDTERFTQTGQVLGTAAYLSPEQAVGDPAAPASDRYALAVVAYELLTGMKPFTGSHFAAQARAHIEDAPPPAPGLPPAAQRVLGRGMAKDPGVRWPTAAAFVDELDAVLNEPAAAPPPPRRSRAPLAALAAAVLVVAGVAVALLAGSGPSDDGRSEAKRPAAHKAKRTATAKPTGAPTAVATDPPTAAPTRVPTAEPVAADAAALNAEGFAAIRRGAYTAAIAPLRRAVDACDGGGELDPCGYAYYNLGLALNRSGDGGDAVAFLQTRLKVWGDNATGDVVRELKRAAG